MQAVKLPYFGKIQVPLKEDEIGELLYKQKRVSLDINLPMPFESVKPANIHSIEKLKISLQNIEAIIDKSQKAVTDSFYEDGAIKGFIKYNVENWEKVGLDKILLPNDSGKIDELEFLALLHVKRVGFYPHSIKNFIIVDFTWGEKVFDTVFAVKLNHDGEIMEICEER